MAERAGAAMTRHRLKLWIPYFGEVLAGRKTFEIRKDDRGYQVGDYLDLYEIDDDAPTGRELTARVVYVLRDGGSFGVHDGYCILGIEREVMDISKLDLRPGDIAVVKLTECLSPEQRSRVSAALAAVLPIGVQGLVLDNEADLQIVRPDARK